MTSDVKNIQLKQTRKVSFSQYALIAVVLFLATKACTLPSLLADTAGAKAIWVVLLLFGTECLLLFFATQTARMGGLFALEVPMGAKIAAGIPLLLFFTLKLAAFTREISTYFALSLFENVPVLPVSIILLVFTCLFAHKGFSSVGRVLEIFVWLFVFVFLFVIIFTRTEGDLFNALAIVNPDVHGMGDGFFRALGWFGDMQIAAFLDLSGQEAGALSKIKKTAPSHRQGKILFPAILCSFLLLSVFYVVFTSVYGESAKMTDYAFIKLSAFRANTDELGSADWPMITLWSVLSFSYLALLLLAGKECAVGIFRSTGQKEARLAFALLSLFALAFSFFLLGESSDYRAFMTKVMNVVTLITAFVTVAMGCVAISKRKTSHE